MFALCKPMLLLLLLLFSSFPLALLIFPSVLCVAELDFSLFTYAARAISLIYTRSTKIGRRVQN